MSFFSLSLLSQNTAPLLPFAMLINWLKAFYANLFIQYIQKETHLHIQMGSSTILKGFGALPCSEKFQQGFHTPHYSGACAPTTANVAVFPERLVFLNLVLRFSKTACAPGTLALDPRFTEL